MTQPDQDEVDIRSRLYQRIHELETQLAQQRPSFRYGEHPTSFGLFNPKRALAETYTIDYGLLDCVDNHLYKPLQGPPVYGTSPPQRTWVDLSRNEILEIINEFYKTYASEREVGFARLIQKAAKEKNNG